MYQAHKMLVNSKVCFFFFKLFLMGFSREGHHPFWRWSLNAHWHWTSCPTRTDHVSCGHVNPWQASPGRELPTLKGRLNPKTKGVFYCKGYLEPRDNTLESGNLNWSCVESNTTFSWLWSVYRNVTKKKFHLSLDTCSIPLSLTSLCWCHQAARFFFL